MKFYKTFKEHGEFQQVEAEGELYQVNGFSFAIEIPKDVDDCVCYGMVWLKVDAKKNVVFDMNITVILKNIARLRFRQDCLRQRQSQKQH